MLAAKHTQCWGGKPVFTGISCCLTMGTLLGVEEGELKPLLYGLLAAFVLYGLP